MKHESDVIYLRKPTDTINAQDMMALKVEYSSGGFVIQPIHNLLTLNNGVGIPLSSHCSIDYIVCAIFGTESVSFFVGRSQGQGQQQHYFLVASLLPNS
jgi:hypothetical protein